LIDKEEEILTEYNREKLIVNNIITRNSSQLVWRIQNFNEESRKAKLRISEPLYSDSFYSEAFSYRLRAVLAPYGMNQGNTTF
jgi:hypothetical protein